MKYILILVLILVPSYSKTQIIVDDSFTKKNAFGATFLYGERGVGIGVLFKLERLGMEVNYFGFGNFDKLPTIYHKLPDHLFRIENFYRGYLTINCSYSFKLDQHLQVSPIIGITGKTYMRLLKSDTDGKYYSGLTDDNIFYLNFGFALDYMLSNSWSIGTGFTYQEGVSLRIMYIINNK